MVIKNATCHQVSCTLDICSVQKCFYYQVIVHATIKSTPSYEVMYVIVVAYSKYWNRYAGASFADPDQTAPPRNSLIRVCATCELVKLSN